MVFSWLLMVTLARIIRVKAQMPRLTNAGFDIMLCAKITNLIIHSFNLETITSLI